MERPDIDLVVKQLRNSLLSIVVENTVLNLEHAYRLLEKASHQTSKARPIAPQRARKFVNVALLNTLKNVKSNTDDQREQKYR